jgi:hypothetical protein
MSRISSSLVLLLALLGLGPAACGGGDDDDDDDTGADGDADADADGDADGDGDAVCTEATPPPCVDQMILDLSLHEDLVSDGDVSTATQGEDFITVVDATAGGFGQSDANPWVYVKFDEDGARKLDIDDETALESMEWDMSLRRFIVRLNGGDSGPSCVGAVSFLEDSYESLTEVPDGLTYRYDDYYTDDCSIVNDSSGLPGSPQVVLGPWWEYPGCVATTDVPHLIQLADGRIVKLVVDSYYEDPADQVACNEEGAAADGSVAAVYTLRWRFMP